MPTNWVHCRLKKNGTLLASYDFLVPETGNDAASRLSTDKEILDEAKANLSNAGLAAPPFDEIEFVIERKR